MVFLEAYFSLMEMGINDKRSARSYTQSKFKITKRMPSCLEHVLVSSTKWTGYVQVVIFLINM